MSLRAILLASVLLALGVAGCGGSSTNSSSAGSGSTASATTSGGAATSGGATAGGAAGALSVKPKVARPSGPPPRHLVIKDIVVGHGPPAASGQTLTVQYVGVAYKSGRQFDASWDRGQPFSFQLGAGMVIPGWDQGLVGMHVGGRRELIVPPALAYGPQGQPPVIGPNETLIFVIDLLKAA